MLNKKNSRTVARIARKYLRVRDAGKTNYSIADQLFDQILALGMKDGDEVVINSGGDRVRMKDLYADRNKVFRSHGIGRFELELLKAS